MTKFSDVIETLDNAADGFDAIANKEQKKLFDDVVTLIKELELDASGNVKQSISNLKRLNQIKAHLSALSKDKEWAAGIGKFLEYFNIIQKQQNEFFSHNFTEYTLGEDAQKKNELMKQIAVQNTIDALMGDGLKANVTDKINDILLRAVTSGAKYADLQAELRAHLMGQNGGQGAFARYATTYATTALSQFTGQHNKLVTDDLGLEWFVYEGSNKETTREFCEQLTKKRFIHISEIPTILTGKIDDYQCAIYPKTGLPLGMIAGTTPENFQCNCGGWNCRHQLVPVADAVVPQALRDKFKKIKPTAPQNEPKQGDTPLDLTPYQEQVDFLNAYVAEHPNSAKIKGYLSAMGAAAYNGNKDELEALIKAAVKDAKKFIASKNATAKKKAEVAQAEAEEKSKIAQAQMATAKQIVNDMIDEYGGYAFDEKMADVIKALHDGKPDEVFAKAKEVEGLANSIKALEYVVNPMKWAEHFTYEELKQADDYVKGHIMHWQKKGKTGEELVKAIANEINNFLDKSHKTYAIVHEAFVKQSEAILKETDAAKFAETNKTIKQYIAEHPKSEKIKNYYLQIQQLEGEGKHNEALVVQAQALADIKKFTAAAKANAKKSGKTEDGYQGTATDDKERDKRVKDLMTFLQKFEKLYQHVHTFEQLKNAVENGNTYRAMEWINACLGAIGRAFLTNNGMPTKVDMEFFGGKVKITGLSSVPLTNLTAEQIKALGASYDKETYTHADARLRGISQSQWATLTAEEKLVITKYTQTFSYLNEPLRNMPYRGERTQGEYERDLIVLTNALAKLKTEKDMVVRRGVDDYFIRELYKNLSDVVKGDVFTDGAFLSTAVHRDKGFHETVNLVIYIPKGSMGFYAEPASHYNQGSYDYGSSDYYSISIWDGKENPGLGREMEWIGQRGSRFEVLKVEKNSQVGTHRYRCTIHLKMIGQLFKQP